MHPARKFSQNICKNKTLNIQSSLNKQNEKSSVTQSFAKKFSVGSHVVSDDHDLFKHKKSIVDEKISVFLDQSQNKTVALEKISLDNEVKYLNRALRNQQGTVIQILSHELQKNEFKNEDLKKLVCTLVQKLSQDEKSTQSCSSTSFRLSDHIMRPYLEHQIVLLEKNLSKLKSREQDLVIIKSMSEQDKKFLINQLREFEKTQRKQLQQLTKIGCC